MLSKILSKIFQNGFLIFRKVRFMWFYRCFLSAFIRPRICLGFICGKPNSDCDLRQVTNYFLRRWWQHTLSVQHSVRLRPASHEFCSKSQQACIAR